MNTLLRIVTALALIVSAPALAEMTVTPVKLSKAVSAKDNVLEFVVSNASDDPLRITLTTAPLAHDRDGSPTLGAPGGPHDASGLIHFDTPTLEIAPRRWKRLRARVSDPSSPGGAYAFIHVTGEKGGTIRRTGIIPAMQIGIVVKLSFPDAGRTHLTLEGVRVGKNGELRVAVRNEGDLHVSPSGVVALHNAQGDQVWEGVLAGGTILPGNVRDLKAASLPSDLVTGEYVLRARLAPPFDASLQTSATVTGGELNLTRLATTHSP